MTGTTRSMTAIAFVSALLACAREPDGLTPAHAAAIGDSVRSAMATYQRFATTARWDSLAAMYSRDDDLRWIEDGKRANGPAIRTELLGLGALHVETAYDSTEVAALAPGVASLTTYHRTHFVGTPVQFAGAISMIWVHEPAGWRIRAGHSSVPVAHGGR